MKIYPDKAIFGWDGDNGNAWNETVKNKQLTEDTIHMVELFELVEVAEFIGG